MASPRIGLYERGEEKAAEWFANYIDAAFEIGGKLAVIDFKQNPRIPFSVKILVPEGKRTDECDRDIRQQFVARVDRIGMDYSVLFAEEGSGEEEQGKEEEEKGPEEGEAEEPAAPEEEEAPTEAETAVSSFERDLRALEDSYKKRRISKAQYESQRADMLRKWKESVEDNLKTTFKRT